jgi:putative ABC transport system permease protein
MSVLGASLGRMSRGLIRSPLFFVTTLLTLGIGIGANAALFSVVYGVLLKPLPFDEPDRLVGVWHTAPGMNQSQVSQGPAFHLTYRDENRAFENIGMWNSGSVTLTGAGEPERIPVLRVTDGVLPALRVRPLVGRLFNREDDSPRSPERAILTYAYWQRKFGADRAIVGRRLMVDGRPREVIGILSDGFDFAGSRAAMLLPMRLDPAEVFVGNFAHRGVARLKPGITVAQANADIARMIPLVLERFPLPPGFTRNMVDEVRLGPNVHPLAIDVIGDVGPVLWLLFGAAGLVLLIACANVANLFLVRAEGRQQEFAIRSALGASRARLAGELLSESAMVGMAGGVLGVALAWASLRMLVTMAPAGLPRLQEIGLSPVVLLFTLAISMLAGALSGLMPVFRLTRPRLAALQDGGRSASDGRERHRARSALVVAEIALAVVLLVGAGLMLRTFQSVRGVEPGFVDPQDVLTLRLSIPETAAAGAEQAARTHEQVVRRIEQVPGVVSVGLASSIPMGGDSSHDPVFVEDFPTPAGQMPTMRKHKWVSPRYFETMGSPLVAGRTLTWADLYTRTPVALVSENLAREYWKTPAAAVGRRVRETPESAWRVIIGVVGDVRDDGASQQAPTIVYWPFLMGRFWGEEQFVQRNMAYAIRTKRLNSPGFLKEIQKAVWSVNPSVPLANVRTLNDIRAESMAQTSFALIMLGISAVVALLLGVVGVYGVIACIAARRTREVGVRMALGAEPRDVTSLFVRHGALLAGLGIVLGVAGAAALSRLMSSLLVGVSPTDPLTYAAVSVGLAALAILAGYLPARRASRVDPVVALRTEA